MANAQLQACAARDKPAEPPYEKCLILSDVQRCVRYNNIFYVS
jgi:hypothetical protein